MEPGQIHLESLPDAVVVVNARGVITRANSHAENLFGYARTELIGQSIEMLVPDRLREGHTEHRTGYAAEPRVRPMGQGMLYARRKDGQEIPVEIMLSPDADGSVVALVRDVSKRRELEQFRDEYMGYISHDLKNPLSVIALQARLLARQLAGRGLRSEERVVEVIAQSAAFIDRLVRELLEMAYLESQNVEIQPVATDLAPFLKAVLERTVSTSNRGRVTLEIRDMVAGLIEPNRIERVVVNLVQNAIKYSPPGSPVLVRLEVREGKAGISVVDKGPGLTAEEQSYMFEKYRRTPAAVKREGLGLGLYISRRIVEAHGGQIGVESTPGEGATLFFLVPMVSLEQKKVPFTIALEVGLPDDRRAGLRGLQLLLVDDEANALSALAALLGAEGFIVFTASSGEEALAAAEARPPDVVILDVEMPGMSGLSLLQRLRQKMPELPAVIMSGFMSHHPGIAEARETTGAAYIGKPVDVDELIRTLGRLFITRSPQS